jgi:hypothetical protein
MNIRGISGNSLIPTQISQQDTISQSDSGIEPSNSPTSALKRTKLMNSRPSNNPTVIHSNSANSLTDSHLNSNIIDRSEYPEGLLSSKQAKSVFEGIHDLQMDNNDSISDDQQLQYDRNSSYGDRQSMSSPEKSRKQMLSSKLFKPFQNMRFRKKNTS